MITSFYVRKVLDVNEKEDEIMSSKQSTPDIRLEYWDIEELSPLSTPAGSPPRSPSPFDLFPRSPSRSPSPRALRSPIPLSSPLLSPHADSPTLKRAKSFNKELRRARSFRAAREKSSSRQNSAACSRLTVSYLRHLKKKTLSSGIQVHVKTRRFL